MLRENMRQEQMIPNRDKWGEAESIMNLLVTGLTPHLREITALRGLRFKESQPMDEYTFGITYLCKMLGEAYLEAGNRQKAMIHYQQSLDLDSSNDNAMRVLESIAE